MLQQTQAPRVVGPFGRWVGAFPDPRSCARAGPAAALRAWEGLGYNRRALNLQRSAVVITDSHRGEVPSDRGALEALPGVGPYTARAVMAFAFGEHVGVVDTNVARVLSRAVAGRRLGQKEVQVLADRLVPPGHSWGYNQTLFDIGAMHCRATNPDCPACPLRPVCAWVAGGRASPDPAERGRRQSRFVGSDRQGRGRLVDALRHGPLALAELATASGWAKDPQRAKRVADGLASEGLASWAPDGTLRLP
jgi:A/G-specific adenine glycosylase